ncbi:spermidine synthase [Thermodesulfobacteriota bacterium]
MIYVITLIVAYCSILYELLLAQTLSALMGNTVLRYSITIGVYLASLGIGAMLCEKGDEQECSNRLIRIEIWLSIIGGLAVLIICSFDVFHRFLISSQSFFNYGFGNYIRPVLFFTLSHTIIALIGILSGFEIPLLIALSEAKKPNTMNVVLGIDYFGSLLGAVLFPLLLLPKLGVFAVAYLTGLLNAIACILLLIFKPATGKFRSVKMTAAIAVGLLLLLAFTENTQHFFLKKFYYYRHVKSLSSLLNSFEDRPSIQEYRSPYQHIHIVKQPVTDTQNMVYARYSDKLTKEPNFPQGMWLFLNNKYQFVTSSEEFYHEFFVHVPIQWKKPPEEVLVLGAGDGLVARELLKYKEVRSIKLVELDPKMLHIARYHPFLQMVNHNSFADPRVTLIVQDAFTWLQGCNQKYDAIYIDFPDPNNYDLAKLYSLEFYSLVRHCVSEDGFVAADLPMGEDLLWAEYYSTLRAAGFEHIKPFDSLVENENEGILELEKQFLDQAVAQQTNEYGYQITINDPKFLRKAFKKLVKESVGELQHRFIFLQSKQQAINASFKDYGIPLYVLNETRLKLASNVEFDDTFKPDRVNSVFRPTMPPFDFFSVNFPY